MAGGAAPQRRLAHQVGAAPAAGQPDVIEDGERLRRPLQRPPPRAPARHRLRVRDLRRRPFAGEINLSAVQRGPFQSAYVGYWIDEARAGHGYVPEALVVVPASRSRSCACTASRSRSSPATGPSRRVVEKLDIRDEGTAVRYLEINGGGRTTSATPSPPRSGRERRGRARAAWLS